jgi:parallel beta-helix repeat protein
VADLTYNPGPGPTGLPSANTCITINADNVDLDLNGHTITGLNGGADGTAGISISAKTKVDIKGPGVITGFGRGFDIDGITDSEVKDVTTTGNVYGFVVNNSTGTWLRGNTSTGNGQHGFTVNGGGDNKFMNNVSSNNGQIGIWLFAGTGDQVRSNTTNSNGRDGIRCGAGGVSTGHTIKDNTANGNGGINLASDASGITVKGNSAQSNILGDLVDAHLNCDNNTWINNTFNTAIPSCIQ